MLNTQAIAAIIALRAYYERKYLTMPTLTLTETVYALEQLGYTYHEGTGFYLPS